MNYLSKSFWIVCGCLAHSSVVLGSASVVEEDVRVVWQAVSDGVVTHDELAGFQESAGRLQGAGGLTEVQLLLSSAAIAFAGRDFESALGYAQLLRDSEFVAAPLRVEAGLIAGMAGYASSVENLWSHEGIEDSPWSEYEPLEELLAGYGGSYPGPGGITVLRSDHLDLEWSLPFEQVRWATALMRQSDGGQVEQHLLGINSALVVARERWEVARDSGVSALSGQQISPDQMDRMTRSFVYAQVNSLAGVERILTDSGESLPSGVTTTLRASSIEMLDWMIGANPEFVEAGDISWRQGAASLAIDQAWKTRTDDAAYLEYVGRYTQSLPAG